MGAVIPSEADLDTLRAIARCGFGRDGTMRACQSVGWELVDEIPDAKVLQYWAGFAAGGRSRCVVTIHREDDQMAPTASVPLWLLRPGSAPDWVRYDRAFRTVADGLTGILGPPTRAGEYSPPHRVGRPLQYAWWRLADATVVLVQNQYDPESDLDVSLWVFPPLDEVRLPVTDN